MKKIITYLKEYSKAIDKRIFILSVLFIAIGIFVNYHYGLDRYINTLSSERQFICWYFIFLIAFSFPYLLQYVFNRSNIFRKAKSVILLLLAPALFAWKMAYTIRFHFTHNIPENAYWNQVIYWPFKLAIFIIVLLIVWKLYDSDKPFYGTGTRYFRVKPYAIMLLIMLPLIAAAATQPDFLAMYPKLKSVAYLSAQQHSGWYKLLFELSYGTDFISIELFFRGFLIIAFAKWVGKDAILPMAMFYCTIHFGKPLGECISSFFGGLILGVITFNTQTIWGGLMVHLGIAWLMELGGYIGNSLLR